MLFSSALAAAVVAAAVERDDQIGPARSAGRGADGDAFIADVGARHADLPGAAAFVQNRQHVVRGHSAGVMLTVRLPPFQPLEPMGRRIVRGGRRALIDDLHAVDAGRVAEANRHSNWRSSAARWSCRPRFPGFYGVRAACPDRRSNPAARSVRIWSPIPLPPPAVIPNRVLPLVSVELRRRVGTSRDRRRSCRRCPSSRMPVIGPVQARRHPGRNCWPKTR